MPAIKQDTASSRLRRAALLAAAAAAALTLPSLARAGGGADPVAPLLLSLALVLAAAKLGGWIAIRVRQPAVLGEILAGILLGNLGLVGIHAFEPMKTDAVLGILASLGVILLLFEVGLESSVEQMLRVGASSLLVAVLGVVTPFALGWLLGAWLLPGHSTYVHAFLGAVLTATSVGITARVLRDLGRLESREAKIILGAAVIDDVLGLLVLAVIAGIITAANEGGAGISMGAVAAITGKAVGFLVGALVLGQLLAPWLLRIASRVRVTGMLLASALVMCFILAWVAAEVGLAPIVGAFAAGLILEPPHFREFEESREHSLESLLHPISSFLVPFFFVLTGLRVDLSSFGSPAILVLAAALTVAAIAGKQICALGGLERGLNRLAIGIGMVPRGEVGLIFANVGASLVVAGERVITPGTYSAVVIMVVITTLLTPPALQWSLSRRDRTS
jgi:Kef-type K+ transport system membrane component KefB